MRYYFENTLEYRFLGYMFKAQVCLQYARIIMYNELYYSRQVL